MYIYLSHPKDVQLGIQQLTVFTIIMFFHFFSFNRRGVQAGCNGQSSSEEGYCAAPEGTQGQWRGSFCRGLMLHQEN